MLSEALRALLAVTAGREAGDMGPTLNDRRILVVDDDPCMLKLLSKHLVSAGYEVLAVESAAEALRILHQDGPAVVLSDWSMPGMTGIELCQTIRASEALGFTYIIILTALSEKQHVVQALEAGANDFLAKPFHCQELLARISAGMRIVSLEADLMRQQRELHKANAELVILNRKLETMATTDELTGLANRREAMERLRAIWSNARRYHQPFSCIMLDLDHFKVCNDTHGHDFGDAVLRAVAQMVMRTVRSSDLACRLGGEEFLVLCPQTPAEMAARGAERLRQKVESRTIRSGGLEAHVTISAGVAQCDATTRSAEDLLKHADEALYAAKHQGRNRVVLFDNCPAAAQAQPSVCSR
jgi:diguanylate cyclase (GGDEF)-like protein